VGTWLPEPVLTDDRVEPESSASLTESLTLAYMVLLETLTPEERAVFVLREVFEYDYDEIAEMLDITAANGRQLFHRAKTRVAERRPRFRVDAGATRALVGRFVSALRAGDGDALTRVLADDVGFWSDGGGKVPAVRHPVAGRDAVVQVLVRIRRAAAALGVSIDTITVDVVEVNHEPGLVMRVAGRLDSVYGLSVEGGAVAAVRIVRNPDKLRFFERQLVEASSSPRPGGDLV